MIAAAITLRRHHGSDPPLALEQQIEMTSYKCGTCGWEVAGKAAQKSARKRGYCWWCVEDDDSAKSKVAQPKAKPKHTPAPWKDWANTPAKPAAPAPSAKSDRKQSSSSGDKNAVHTWQQHDVDADDYDEESGDAVEVGQSSTQEQAEELTELKKYETSLLGMIREAKTSKYGGGHITGMESELAMCRNKIRLTQPVPKRVKTLRKALGNRETWVEEAKAAVAEKTKALTDAVEELKKAKSKLENAEEKLASISDQLDQAIAEQDDEVVAKSSDSASKLLELLGQAVVMPGATGDLQASFAQAAQMVQTILEKTKGVSVPMDVTGGEPKEASKVDAPPSPITPTQVDPVTSSDSEAPETKPLTVERPPANAPNVPQLPFGWARQFCPQQQKEYFWNTVTGQATWEVPDAPACHSQSPSKAVPEAKGLDAAAEEKAAERNQEFKKACSPEAAKVQRQAELQAERKARREADLTARRAEAAVEQQPQQTHVPVEIAAEQQARHEALLKKQRDAAEGTIGSGVNVAIHSDSGDSDDDIMKTAEDLLKGTGEVFREGTQAPEPLTACPEVVCV